MPDADLRLQLRARADSVEAARKAIAAYTAGSALTSRQVYSLDLLVEEAIMNIARHAYDDPEQASLALQLAVLPDRIVLQVADSGRAFDPTAAPEVVVPASLDEARPGGLGLKLMRQRADEWRYTRQDGQNRSVLVIRRR